MTRHDPESRLARPLRAFCRVALLALGLHAAAALAAPGDPDDYKQDWKLPTETDGEPLPKRAPPPTGLTAEAVRLEFGEGVGRNVTLAIDLYCRSARMGDADAAYRLGLMYANGRGVTRDDRIATGLLRYASDRSHEYAARMLRHVNTTEAVLPACMINEAVIAQESHAMPLAWTATPERQYVVRIVQEMAPGFGIDPRLALAVIQAESGFQISAKSNKNAQGLMQLIPETAERFNVKNIMDPRQNIKGGLSYLRWLLAYFEGDLTLVTAAYNAGEGAVVRYRGVPPYAETRQYVARVTGVYGKVTHKFNPVIVDPSAMAVARRMQTVSMTDTLRR